jgi:hypothetical protein
VCTSIRGTGSAARTSSDCSTSGRPPWLQGTPAERTIEHPYEDIAAAEATSGLLQKDLELLVGGDKVVFADIVPRARAAELAEAIRERARPASPSAPGGD